MLKRYNSAIERAGKALSFAKRAESKNVKLKMMKLYHNAMRDAAMYQEDMRKIR